MRVWEVWKLEGVRGAGQPASKDQIYDDVKFQSPVSGRGRQVRQGFRVGAVILELQPGLTTAALLLPLFFSATPTDAKSQPKNVRY